MAGSEPDCAASSSAGVGVAGGDSRYSKASSGRRFTPSASVLMGLGLALPRAATCTGLSFQLGPFWISMAA